MPVYLLACAEDLLPDAAPPATEDLLYHFFHTWIYTIRGEYSHVELAFGQEGKYMGFWISENVQYATFGTRDYTKMHREKRTVWWELKGISKAKELEMYAMCSEIFRTKSRKMNTSKMLMSGFPYPDYPFFTKILRHFVHTIQDPDDQTVSLTKTNKATQDAYCCSVVGEVLGIPQADTKMPLDIVLYCEAHFEAEQVVEPFVSPSEIHATVRDAMGIIRFHLV